MAAGLIDGFCAGEPWNSLAVSDGTGWCPAVSSELAPGHAEKVLLVHEAFAGESPGRLQRLLEALTESCRWCDAAKNRPRLVSLLTATGHFPEGPGLSASLPVPFADGTGRDRDASSFHIFHRNEANHPVADRGLWILNELIRHGVFAIFHS